MKILITGSSGMLGTELCDVLAADHHVIGIDVAGPHAANGRLQGFHEADITDTMAVKEVFKKEQPDLVIHAAAWTDVDGCEEDPDRAYAANTAGTRNMASLANVFGASIIFISTDFVFDGKKKAPYTEDDSTNPISVYGKTKWEAEEIIKKETSGYTIVRTSWLYGAEGTNFVDTIITRGKTGGKLNVVNDQVGSPTYVRDLATAIRELISVGDHSKGSIFHVSNSGQCSWYDFAREILADVPDLKDVAVEPITSEKLKRPAKRPGFSVLDNGKFQKATGHKMRSWQEALEEYIKQRHK